MIFSLCGKIAQRVRSLFIWVLIGSLQPHPTLFRLRSFWLVAGLPIIIAVIVWFYIFKSLGYPDIDATYAGFNRAYEYFKVPLWIAALSIPIAGIFASNYRSVETAKQLDKADEQLVKADDELEEVKKKNTFDNSARHLELFKEYVTYLETLHHIKIKNYVKLYKAIFPENDFENFTPWSDEMTFYSFTDTYENEHGDEVGGDEIMHDNYICYIKNYFNDISVRYAQKNELTHEDFFDSLMFLAKEVGVEFWDGFFIGSESKARRYFFFHRLDDKGEEVCKDIYHPEMRRFSSSFYEYIKSLESFCYSKSYFEYRELIDAGKNYRLGLIVNKSDLLKREFYKVSSDGEVSRVKGLLPQARAYNNYRKTKRRQWEKHLENLK